MLAATWGTGQVLLDMLWLVLFVIEIWLLLTIFVDLFRRHDIKGWLKAVWVLGLIAFPLLGILVYLIVYGGEMRTHALQEAVQERAFRDYMRGATGTPSVSDELNRLADLRDRGVIDDDEFTRLKKRIIYEGSSS